MSKIQRATTVATSRTRRHTTFFMEQLFVQVQDTLFQIPRVVFEGRQGSPFADAATLATQQDTNLSTTEGSSADNPVVLPVDLQDFEDLLHMMYASGSLIPNYPSEISSDQWKGTLRLAILWNFDDIRAKALKALEANTEKYPLERISVAREFRLRKWLISGYGELIAGPLTALEPKGCAATLGWETLALLYHARGEYWTAPMVDPERLVGYLNNGNSGIQHTCSICPRNIRWSTRHPVGSACPTGDKGTVVFSRDPQLQQNIQNVDFNSPILVTLIERIFADELAGMHA
ncbi:hypothetical protein BJ165DRAFT_289881 [Panaeolus papilionaceus]|nr:hypothetical protein BJ165DRAFT_289881 [Panaeolus papilionaceus]